MNNALGLITEQVKINAENIKTAAKLYYGTIASGGVIIDGDTTTSSCVMGCSAEIGDRVTVARKGRDLVVIANLTNPTIQSFLIGEIKQYAGATIPDGWLSCDGSAISRTTYSELFSVIGTTYGTGDGSTTFNLPDLQGRVAIGSGTVTDADSATKTFSLGDDGGSLAMQKHTHTLQKNVPYGMPYNASSGYGSGSSSPVYGESYSPFSILDSGTGTSGNLQPYLAINYITYAGV